MKFHFKKLPGSKISLEVILDQKEFQNYWQSAYNQELSSVHLKGFRPGAAPKELADKAVDKEKVFEQAASQAVRCNLDDISKENHWTIIDKPQIEVDEYKLGLKYKTILTIFPEIKFADYKKIAKKIFSESSKRIQNIKVEAQEIENALEWLRQSRKKDDKISELNDEFAKNLGNFKNLQDLRINLEKNLKIEKEFKERQRARAKVLEEIIKNSKIDIPEIMIEKTLEKMSAGKKELREKLQDKARENVAANLILYKIAEKEKIEYNSEEGLENQKVFQYLESLS